MHQQGRNPGGEAIEAHDLRGVEDRQDDGAAEIGRGEGFGERSRGDEIFGRGRLRLGQSRAALGGDLALEVGDDPQSLVAPAVPGEPARAFRQAESHEPDDQRAGRADQHDRAPVVEAEGRGSLQAPGEQRANRHGEKHDELIEAERAPARLRGNQLGNIGVDRHQFDADADARDEPPDDEIEAIGLKRHDRRGDGVPNQRSREHAAAPEPVGDLAERQRSHPQPGEGREDEDAEAGDSSRSPARRICPATPA